MRKKNRMKNGLDMLFEDNFHEESEAAPQAAVQSVRISLVEPDKNQPRTAFDEDKLRELSENIAQHGVLQPILVKPLENGSYRIVAGERRWRASRLAGLTEIPVVIKDLTELEAAQVSLIENLQREDLSPIEEAAAYKRLMDEFGMTQQQLSESLGRSRAAIANSVRMLKLPEAVRKEIAEGRLSSGHAKLLCGLEDEELIILLAARCESEGLTVRQLEGEISRSAEVKEKKKPASSKSVYSEFEKNAVSVRKLLKDMYDLDAEMKKERGGKVSVKFTFDKEDELMKFIGELEK